MNVVLRLAVEEDIEDTTRCHVAAWLAAFPGILPPKYVYSNILKHTHNIHKYFKLNHITYFIFF